ncbi:hypothetical protein HYV49_04860 [Candidatus Pacearchaeota archaeon]|nr:hypothetical protein [Candidatus Pacearchaeota archaeon]
MNYIEKLCEWHKYPINAFLHLVALIVLIFALWNHSWVGIVSAFIIVLIGHLIQETYDHKARIDKLEKKKK